MLKVRLAQRIILCEQHISYSVYDSAVLQIENCI